MFVKQDWDWEWEMMLAKSAKKGKFPWGNCTAVPYRAPRVGGSFCCGNLVGCWHSAMRGHLLHTTTPKCFHVMSLWLGVLRSIMYNIRRG
jgi:hypothetical protein